MGFSRRDAALPPARVGQSGSSARWLYGYVLLLMLCQLALLFESLGAFRLVARSFAFASSLVLLVVLPGRSPRHPAKPWAVAVLVIVALGMLHPATNSVFSGTAQLLMYAAILAPLFWAGRVAVTPAVFQRLLLLLWGFYTLSAVFGVLQVSYPGRFQPAVSARIAAQDWYMKDLKITLADGEQVLRPMGLTDMPGGAGAAGLSAALFGVGFLLNSRSALVRVVAPFTIAVGLFCIYLSQVRLALVMFVICAVAFTALILRRGEVKRVLVLFLLVPATIAASLVWAIAVGGETVTKRLSTLTEDNPGEVYYKSGRGRALEVTLTEDLPEYFLGAGAGRWGMMYTYFGDKDNPSSPRLWAEIQWTGWLYDGGVLLMVVYPCALLAACAAAWKLAAARNRTALGPWAALILAYDVTALATIFSYAFFISQSGMEFWLLNACLFRASLGRVRARRAPAEGHASRVPYEPAEPAPTR
jgi:hypothetical protein